MKKRFFCLFLIMSCLLSSCAKQDNTDTTSADTAVPSVESGAPDITDTSVIEDTEYVEGSDIDVNYDDADLLLICYINGGVSVKEIKGDVGGELVAKLSALTPNGEKSAKISDEPFSFQHQDVCYAPKGTFWVKTEDGIYRISPEKVISKAEDYYLEGDILEADSEFFDYISDLWEYYPRNTLVCTYKDGRVKARRVFGGESEVVIDIASVTVSADATATNATNKLEIVVTSKTDKDVTIEAVPQCGPNEFAKVQSQDVKLKANESAYITLPFGGWQDKGYEVNVIVDDARLHLEITP